MRAIIVTKYRNILVITVLALLLALAPLAIVVDLDPVSAHAPEGAPDAGKVELSPIVMYDRHGELIEITIEDLAENEGNLCVCVATCFRVTRTAIEELYSEDEIPAQGNIEVIYRHPGKGHKNSFEHIFTPESATYVKTGNPHKMTPDNWVYTFTRLDTGELFKTQVKDGVIPAGFFDLRYKVNGFKNGWHETEPTEKEKAEWVNVWSQARDNFLTLPSWELYSGVEEPEEPAPAGAIIFSGTLIVLVVFGFIYSARGKRGR